LRKKVRIGELLVQNRVITEDQLNTALAEQKKRGARLGRALIDLGYVDEDRLLNLLAMQLQIPFIELKNYPFKPEVIRLLPETHARRFRAIALQQKGHDILVAMADPADIFATDELSRILKHPVKQAVARESELLRTIDVVYRRHNADLTSLVEELHSELSEGDSNLGQLLEVDDNSEAPVAKLLENIFDDALHAKASDIHIEPDENLLRIRQRVDGILTEQIINEKRIIPALVLRLKIMAGLNIAEKRLPQDGRFNMTVGEKRIDVRLSTMPVQHGESVVMRLLDQSATKLSLDDLGIPDDILRRMRSLIHRPHGILLVTGPTGSGKTTTLYSALTELNVPATKIITAEDPVEFRLERLMQVQVNTKIGLTFANVLRTALRQDPDVIMVGEMRDAETVEIGVRAALTGHLVLSTLHTNDAVSSATRLNDMGVAGYLTSAALLGVVAQRLVRVICADCASPYQPSPQEGSWLGAIAGPVAAQLEFRKGKGCGMCNQTGYAGRRGVYELLEMDEPMAEALRHNDTDAYVAAASRAAGYRPLHLCALDYATEGITTLSEVFRLAGELEDQLPADTSEDIPQDAPEEVTD